MFDSGLDALLRNLPDVEALPPAEVRRLLTGAFVDVLSARDFDAPDVRTTRRDDLRRLATALELQVVLDSELDEETVEACAFTAAEALEIVREIDLAAEEADVQPPLVAVPEQMYSAIEAGALYLIAGYDANAAVASRAVDPDLLSGADVAETPAAQRAARSIRALLSLSAVPSADFPDLPDDLSVEDEVRWEVWRRIAVAVDLHLGWLRTASDSPSESRGGALAALAELLDRSQRHADQSHLALLLGKACDATEQRSLRSVAPPADPEIWDAYLATRVLSRPLLWPAAKHYADATLPGPDRHAVVAVPTGAGKSSVAEMAIAQAAHDGWVLYLAPTNALVAQVIRDLRGLFDGIEGVEVRGYLGGSEYTELPGEAIESVSDGHVLVMTPEKCSLALRQAPDDFARLRLIVLDECHLLGDPGSRGVIAELVAAECLYRAPNVRALLLSALVSNPDELASWLRNVTDLESEIITEPWRPTRTLRAMLGIEPAGANQAFRTAKAELEERAARRNWQFDAPAGLLANLQGAWATVNDEDYVAVTTGFTLPLTAVRRNSGAIEVERGGYVNQAAGVLTHRLAEAGQRVLTFLPANKHYSFSVARDLPDLTPRPQRSARLNEIKALLDMADFEFGVPTILRDLIDRGIAVHTSAMLRDEQRASELAFVGGQARAMFATGTLAQGLNLPATAVVIAGTRVGDDRAIPEDIREERARAQLLNALGRAGRAYVASRSVGIVIPDKWVVIDVDDASAARERARFLEYPDASTEVRSQVKALIESALEDPEVDVGLMTDQEQTAFAFLATGESPDGGAIVQRSLGAFNAGIDAEGAESVTESLSHAGRQFVDLADAPQWISEASHVSGIGLPMMAALYSGLSAALDDGPTPDDVGKWRDTLLAVLGSVEPNLTKAALPEQPFKSTRMDALVKDDLADAEYQAGLRALGEVLADWMNGESLADVAATAISEDVRDDDRRGSGHALPKVVAVTENGFGFAVSALAGGIVALVSSESDAGDDEWGVDGDERTALDLLPLAVRFGTSDLPSTAWYRWGFRRRRIAHWLADEVSPPSQASGDELADWIFQTRRALLAGELDETFDEPALERLDSLKAAEGT